MMMFSSQSHLIPDNCLGPHCRVYWAGSEPHGVNVQIKMRWFVIDIWPGTWHFVTGRYLLIAALWLGGRGPMISWWWTDLSCCCNYTTAGTVSPGWWPCRAEWSYHNTACPCLVCLLHCDCHSQPPQLISMHVTGSLGWSSQGNTTTTTTTTPSCKTVFIHFFL